MAFSAHISRNKRWDNWQILYEFQLKRGLLQIADFGLSRRTITSKVETNTYGTGKVTPCFHSVCIWA